MPWPKRCAQCKLRIDWLKAIFYRAKHFVAHILLGRIAILCEEYLAQIRVKINLNPLIDCSFIPECPPMHAISTGLIPDRCTFFSMVCMTNGYNQKFCIAVFLRHCLKSKMSNCSKTYTSMTADSMEKERAKCTVCCLPSSSYNYEKKKKSV